ncbi:MAG: engB [Ilumatobacteraceae bacterium]|nr:engB [Ilumatobacteraceae bacterium]
MVVVDDVDEVDEVEEVDDVDAPVEVLVAREVAEVATTVVAPDVAPSAVPPGRDVVAAVEDVADVVVLLQPARTANATAHVTSAPRGRAQADHLRCTAACPATAFRATAFASTWSPLTGRKPDQSARARQVIPPGWPARPLHARRYRERMPLQLTFVMSAKRHTDLPAATAEIAVVGRSNVGKSSLLNALANRRQLAKVSNTPGRTQLINLFVLPGGGSFVDLPGYGYAKVPQRERKTWQEMIEGYLLEREGLELVLVLVDGEIGPTKLDLQMLGWLHANSVPHTVVATKLDKVRPSKRSGRRQQLARACGLDPGDVMWVSAANGTGIDQLQSHVHALLDA